MQCPRCQQQNPTSQKHCGECGTSLTHRDQGSPPAASYADLQREVEHLARTLSEAHEQQTATSEILRVISSSPTSEQPVFDAVARRAVELCNGTMSAVFRLEGDVIHHVAGHGHRREEIEEIIRVRHDQMPA